MSYAKTLVRIPSSPLKITRKPLASGSYVYLEIGRSYNSERKHTVPIRKTIGKLEDKYTGKTVAELQEATHMYPNSNYFIHVLNKELPPEDEEKETDEDFTRSSCLSIGAYVVIRHLFKKTGIKEILEEILGKDAGLFMDFATYSIIYESNVAEHYPSYCYRHPLFTDGMKAYSDSTISRFFNRITKDHSIDFQDKWNASRDKSVEILLSYDSTNKNTKAGQIEKAEYSKAAKDNENVPIVNYAIAYDATNYDPLFYENYPGSNPDVGQLTYTIERMENYKYKKITFVLDRGYFSEDNIHGIESAGFDFIIMSKGKSKFLQETINQKKGTFERDRACYHERFHVYGSTYEGKLYESDTKNRYFQVYYNDIDGAVEREKLNRSIRKYREALDKLVGKPLKAKTSFKDFERYFDCILEEIPVQEPKRKRKKSQKRMKEEVKNPPKRYLLKSYSEKTSAINEDYNSHGYFAIVTSKEMSSAEAIAHYWHYWHYKGRDCSEKLFLADKSFLGNSAYRVYTDDSEEAKTFIGFVASIIRNRMFHMLNSAAEKNESRASRMTVPAAIAELEKIEIIRTNGQNYGLDHAVTALQKVILSAFELTEKDIENETANINKVLFPG